MKKALKCIVAVVLVVALLCTPLMVSAEISTEDPRYRYSFNGDGTITIETTGSLGVSGKADVWYIPSTLDGYTVTGLDLQSSGIDTKALIIPGTIKELTPYSLSTEFDVLYLNEGLETISYLVDFYSSKQLAEVVIPTTVTSIAQKAFGWYGYEERDEDGRLIPGGQKQVDHFTVYSYGNDVAKEYAQLEGYTYIDLSDYAFGDMDIDGTIDMMDIMALYQMPSGIRLGSPVEHVMGDYDGDGTIDMMDVAAAYAKVAGR